MKQNKRAGLILIIIAFAISAIPASAQELRETAPLVIKDSESYIVRGQLLAIGGNRISMQPERGGRISLDIDDRTDVYEDGGLISIATMDEVRLSAAALRAGNIVEIVVERDGNRRVARIITRLALFPGHLAKRKK
jgi:hypothetical protein